VNVGQHRRRWRGAFQGVTASLSVSNGRQRCRTRNALMPVRRLNRRLPNIEPQNTEGNTPPAVRMRGFQEKSMDLIFRIARSSRGGAFMLLWAATTVQFTLAALPPGANWAAWRGDGSGISAETNLPVSWSATNAIAWRTPLPGEGSSSPIVWDRRVFVTASTAAMDGSSGSARSSQDAFRGPIRSPATPRPRRRPMGNGCMSFLTRRDFWPSIWMASRSGPCRSGHS